MNALVSFSFLREAKCVANVKGWLFLNLAPTMFVQVSLIAMLRFGIALQLILEYLKH